MRTPAEFEPLGLWMGWKRLYHSERGAKPYLVWHDEKGGLRGMPSKKTSLTDAEVVEALNRLVEKGYSYGVLGGPGLGHSVAVFTADARIQLAGTMHQPTIPAAVEEALLKLIAAEGGKE